MASSHQRPLSDMPLIPSTATLRRPASENLELQQAFRSKAAAAASVSARPSSEVLSATYKSPEAEAIDRWFEDLSYYERTLEQMTRAKLDDHFREELRAIEKWFNVLSDPERTTALYTLLQNTTQVQIRFFVTVLQQMTPRDQLAGPLSPTQTASTAALQPTKAPPVPIVSIPSPMTHPDSEGSTEDDFVSVNKMALARNSRRLYDRHSATFSDDKFTQVLGSTRLSRDSLDFGEEFASSRYMAPSAGSANSAPNVKRISTSSSGSGRTSSAIGSSSVRPKTPVDDPVMSANWSVGGTPAVSERTTSLNIGVVPPRIGARTTSNQSPLLPGSHTPLESGFTAFRPTLSPSRPLSPGHGSSSSHLAVSSNPAALGDYPPVSPLRTSLSMVSGVHPNGIPTMGSTFPTPLDMSVGAPSGWTTAATEDPITQEWNKGGDAAPLGANNPSTSTVDHAVAGGVSLGTSVPVSGTMSYATSEFSDDGGDYDHGDLRSRGGVGGPHHKEKGKIPESVDLEAIKDIPSWLRSLRLHKYTPIFENDNWRAMILLSEEDLIQRGVAALGARRKMMKVFELVRKELDA
ncbi:hypothetical protein BASA50_000787 [Batrachochytrium salamandrivorans]|uniref:SAM domain-containing protein n=1 Tax=Batrachochytrium salamandrivorans TaxID=1357716 RepID=A0ABQ8ETE8_9FUNG|nr:hypothetical protein BASA62_000158 [Batrachochytrium salamandrivorans]KAH6586082.1 hypothetical protein BASA50_000787 [Batrachochytrium salamandrivorans]KAH6599729.1 hypothetical protein BASA61_002497 [Batrachochytrium salamandrivorans]KAJ1339912.1 hypothetical protein BSLG_005447 [Batrachochytrium salamandrivorans]